MACSFWLVSALAAVGRWGEAQTLMSEMLPLANDAGLYSEMIDPSSGEFLGNMQQASSHPAVLDAALTLADQARPGLSSPDR